MAAISVSSFLGKLGVNTHLNFAGTAYDNPTAVINALNALGIARCRDILPFSFQYPNYLTVGRAGIAFDMVGVAANGATNPPLRTPAQVVTDAKAFLSQSGMAGKILTLEGANEVNNYPFTYGSGGAAGDVQFQQQMYAAWKADGTVNSIPVFCFSIAASSATTWQAWGDMSAYCDFGNGHPYANNGEQPTGTQFGTDQVLAWYQSLTPSRTMAITETGYTISSARSSTGYVDQTTQAKLLLNTIMMLARKPTLDHINLYELNDYGGEGFGIYNQDWTPRVAATAIGNFTHILKASGTPASDPAYTVSGLSGFQFLFARPDGSRCIVLWSEPDIWNQNTHTEIAPPAQAVTITPTGGPFSWAVWDPMVSATTPRASGVGTSIPVTVQDHPVIVTLAPTSSGATLAVTERRDVMTASAVATQPAATLAVTERRDTMSASAGVLISGSLAVTEGRDSNAATATVTVVSNFADITEGRDALVATGSVAISGSLAVTEGRDSQVATATLIDIATCSAAITEGRDTMAATGYLPAVCTLNVQMATDSIAASASVAGTKAHTAKVPKRHKSANV